MKNNKIEKIKNNKYSNNYKPKHVIEDEDIIDENKVTNKIRNKYIINLNNNKDLSNINKKHIINFSDINILDENNNNQNIRTLNNNLTNDTDQESVL